MLIQRTNSTNFNGGYKFIRMPKEAREKLPDLIKKGKIIYDGFEGKKNNVFLITRDEHHDIVSVFIKNNNLNYRYYPNVNLSMVFPEKHPEKAEGIIKDMHPVEIEFTDSMEKRVSQKNRRNIVEKHGHEYVKNILDALHLKADVMKSRKQRDGVNVISDLSGMSRVYISPPDDKGIHYVKVEKLLSMSGNTTERYSFTFYGQKLDDSFSKTPDKMLEFKRLYENTLLK